MLIYWVEALHTVKENTEALVSTSKETEPEVNVDKTKYMVTSQDQDAGRSHNQQIDNSSFERVKEFKYLGTTLCGLYTCDYYITRCIQEVRADHAAQPWESRDCSHVH